MYERRQLHRACGLSGVSALALISSLMGSTAWAQAASRPPAGADSQATTIGELVVTAEKREERLQDVPVVVTVLTDKKLQSNNVRSVADLVTLTPGLTSTTNGTEGTTIARIRGVGNVADNPGLEDAVGLYIDGVYRPRNGVSFNDLGELNQIEILKGPQGTLFGKNTIAGVIQITTKRPSFTFGAEGEATVESYSGYGGSISMTGPLNDQLAFRAYVADRQRDGFIHVVQAPGSNIPSQNDEHIFTTRDQLLWKPSDTFDINIIADYSRRKDHCCVALDYLNGVPAVVQDLVFPGTIPNPVDPRNRLAYLNTSNVNNITDKGVSAEAHWKTPWLNGATLTSITALRDNKETYGGDTDSTLAPFLSSSASDNFTRFKQFSQEFQYRGSTDWLNWQVGFFYSHETLGVQDFLQNGPALGPYLNILFKGLLPANGYPTGEGATNRYHQREHSEAIYTQEEFKITDHLSLIGGLRYTWEHKDLTSSYSNNDTAGTCEAVLQALLGSPTPIPTSAFALLPKAPIFGTACLVNPAFNGLNTTQKLDEKALTGTAKIQYKLDETKMAYASYSKGNLVGGFNLAEVTLPFAGGAPNTSLAPQTDTSFPAEWVDAFEIGAKTQWLDRRLSVNTAAFYQKYKNHQLNAFTGTQFVEFTIPEAITEGVELETYYVPTRNLTLNGGVTYAYSYYPGNERNKSVLQAPGSNLYLLPGNRLTYAPMWSATAGISYKHPIADDLNGFVNVDAKYTSSYQIGSDEDPSKKQSGFTIVNASVGVTTFHDKVQLSVWATNLFNQFYKQTAFDGVLQTFSSPPAANPGENNYYYFPGAPRMVGATLRVHY